MSDPHDASLEHASRSAKLHWDSSNQPVSGRFDDIYFSKENGLEESRYVFLKGNQLEQRFTAITAHDHFTVAETGFGTGLNFLSCWQLWQQRAHPDARLSFISVEKYPLLPDELERALSLWPSLAKLSSQLISQYRHHYCADKAMRSTPMLNIELGKVRLLLIIDDAAQGLSRLHTDAYRQWRGVDAWFLDGFAPAKNPEMWSPALFQTIQQLSDSQTTLATFTAAGAVRRGLKSAGFTIDKIKGFAHKREMLVGRYLDSEEITANSHPSPNQTQWMISPRSSEPVKTVAIIGGGLAGCHSAYALAKRGLDVTVIEREDQVAAGASGNPQGILYGKLSAHAQTLNDFNLFALLYAQQCYSHYWQANQAHSHFGQACSVLQLSLNQALEAQHQTIAEQCRHSDFVRHVDSAIASEIAGLPIPHSALYFPLSGWVAPRQLCQWLLAQYPVNLKSNIAIQTLEKQDQGWCLYGYVDGNRQDSWQAEFDAVVIANANDATQFNQSQWLPSKAIRGQISVIRDSSARTQENEQSVDLSSLQTAVCGEGYIAPANFIEEEGKKKAGKENGEAQQTIGASYALNRRDDALCEQEHQQNLEHLQGLLEIPAKPRITGGRVSFRCTSPDYLPFVGQAPDYAAFLTDFAELRHNAKAVIKQTGTYHEHLYLNLAHGSRGLCYTPLAAEILACHICGEAPPIPQTMVDAINPARFIIRNLKRRVI